MSNLTIELAPFRLGDGVDPTRMEAASARLETDFLADTEGYLGRLLLKQGDRNYVDLVFWRSRADADRAAEKAATNEACHAYFACMVGVDHDDPGAGVEHYAVVRTFGRAVAALAAEREAA